MIPFGKNTFKADVFSIQWDLKNIEMMEKKTRTFQLALDEQQIRILVAGLHKLPGGQCMDLLGSIRNQIRQQMQVEGRSAKSQV